MIEGIGMVDVVTWAGMAGLIVGSVKVGLNGIKRDMRDTRRAVEKIGDKVVVNCMDIATLKERTAGLNQGGRQ